MGIMSVAEEKVNELASKKRKRNGERARKEGGRRMWWAADKG